jgi:hypothetical protein
MGEGANVEPPLWEGGGPVMNLIRDLEVSRVAARRLTTP